MLTKREGGEAKEMKRDMNTLLYIAILFHSVQYSTVQYIISCTTLYHARHYIISCRVPQHTSAWKGVGRKVGKFSDNV